MPVDLKNVIQKIANPKETFINQKRNQIKEHKLRKALEKYGEVKSMGVRQGKHGRKGNIGMTCLIKKEQTKPATKMLNKTICSK